MRVQTWISSVAPLPSLPEIVRDSLLRRTRGLNAGAAKFVLQFLPRQELGSRLAPELLPMESAGALDVPSLANPFGAPQSDVFGRGSCVEDCVFRRPLRQI